jgi:hypothetical protein
LLHHEGQARSSTVFAGAPDDFDWRRRDGDFDGRRLERLRPGQHSRIAAGRLEVRRYDDEHGKGDRRHRHRANSTSCAEDRIIVALHDVSPVSVSCSLAIGCRRNVEI